MNKFLKIFQVVLQYGWVLEAVFDVVKKATELLENKEAVKALFQKIKSLFGEIEITKESLEDFQVSAELVHQAGGIRKLREFLQEAKRAGLLEKIDDLIPDDSPLLRV